MQTEFPPSGIYKLRPATMGYVDKQNSVRWLMFRTSYFCAEVLFYPKLGTLKLSIKKKALSRAPGKSQQIGNNFLKHNHDSYQVLLEGFIYKDGF